MSDRYRRLLGGETNPYESVEELRTLSEQELIKKHDSWMAHVNKLPAMDKTALTNRARIYTDELQRREMVRQGDRMEALTRSMYVLSAVGVLVAIVGVILTAMTYFSG
jgi:hypothetical protein